MNQATDTAHQPVAHERSDVNTRAILLFGVALAAALVTITFLIAWQFRTLRRQDDARRRPPDPRLDAQREWLQQGGVSEPVRAALPAPPRLDTLPQTAAGPRDNLWSTATSAEQARHEDALLDSYGPVTGRPGTVHIPVEQAMRQLVEESRWRPTHKPAQRGKEQP